MKPLQFIFLLAWACATIFGLFAFYNWQIDPGLWSKDSRAFCTMLIGSVLFIAPMAYIESRKS